MIEFFLYSGGVFRYAVRGFTPCEDGGGFKVEMKK
jgi:hypothetical protein